MAVPEPDAGFGLWARVKPVTGWPESNEDTLAELARGWRQGGEAFTRTGGHDLGPAQQAWADVGGAAFATRAGRNLRAATDHGAGMAALSSRVEGFAAEVVGLKNGIRSAIAVNDPLYGLIGTLPPPLGVAGQVLFANQTADMVNGMIMEAAARVSAGSTPGGPRVVPAANPVASAEPPPGNDPAKNKQWWEGLTPEERARLVRERPELIGGLDGLPATARDDANRLVLERLPGELRAEAARLRAEIGQPGLDPDSALGQLARAEALEQRAAQLEKLRERLGPDNAPYDPNDPGKGDQRYFLLGFDNAGDGRAIVARGNPDTAQNVATLVPGIMNDITTVGESTPPKQSLIDRIDVLHEAATNRRNVPTSVIGWLDYDTPSGAAVPGTFSGDAADSARKDLQSFQQGLRASHLGPPSHNTLIGHSYGALVAGAAARDGNLQIDDFVSVNSLGNGTQHASELRATNVWVTEHNDDPSADLGVHGRDPSDIRYGAKVFESDPLPGTHLPQGVHSGAFDRVPGNVGLDNLGRIIAGDPPPVLERKPVLRGATKNGPIYDYDPP